MSGQGLVAASTLGSRGCAATAACLKADKNNKEGPRQELEQESAAYRWHRDALRSLACGLVLRSIEAASQTGIIGGCYSGIIDWSVAFLNPTRSKSARILSG